MGRHTSRCHLQHYCSGPLLSESLQGAEVSPTAGAGVNRRRCSPSVRGPAASTRRSVLSLVVLRRMPRLHCVIGACISIRATAESGPTSPHKNHGKRPILCRERSNQNGTKSWLIWLNNIRRPVNSKLLPSGLGYNRIMKHLMAIFSILVAPIFSIRADKAPA